jgi:hypothetical protein
MERAGGVIGRGRNCSVPSASFWLSMSWKRIEVAFFHHSPCVQSSWDAASY